MNSTWLSSSQRHVRPIFEGRRGRAKGICSLHKPVPASRQDLGGGRRPPESSTTSRHPDASPPEDLTAGPHRTGNLGRGCQSPLRETESCLILPRLSVKEANPPRPLPKHALSQHHNKSSLPTLLTRAAQRPPQCQVRDPSSVRTSSRSQGLW